MYARQNAMSTHLSFTLFFLKMSANADLTTIAFSVAGFLLAGAWREFHRFKRDVEQWQSKIDVVLFGPQGDNGLNGTSKDHESRLRLVESQHS